LLELALALVFVDRYPFLHSQLVQQVSENNFTAKEESSAGLPILSVVDIGLDSN
jgi:hypothetical protein